jgi:hypothetical protein
MIVEDQLDRRVGRISDVDKLEKLDEFATAVAIPDQGVNPSGQQINARQQTDGAFALVFMIARKGRVHAGLGRQAWWRSPECPASRHRRKSLLRPHNAAQGRIGRIGRIGTANYIIFLLLLAGRASTGPHKIALTASQWLTRKAFP